MPEEGAARQVATGWEVSVGGEWVPLDQIELPEGAVAFNVDPRGPRLIIQWSDGTWTDIEGNDAAEAPSAVSTRPLNLPADFPWPPMKTVPDLSDISGLRKTEVVDYEKAQAWREKYGEEPKKAGIFASPDEAQARIEQAGLGETHEAAYSPKDDAYVIRERPRADRAQALREAEFAFRQQATKQPTFVDEIYRLLYEWATTGSQATLDKALSMDAVRDQVNERPMSQLEAAQFAAQNADSPEEARRWIEVLTNPFGRPTGAFQAALQASGEVPTSFRSQAELGLEFARAAAQPGAPPVEPAVRAFLDHQAGETPPGFGAFPPLPQAARGEQPFPEFRVPFAPREFGGTGTFGAAETGEARFIGSREQGGAANSPIELGGEPTADELARAEAAATRRFRPSQGQIEAATRFPPVRTTTFGLDASAGQGEPTAEELAQAERDRVVTLPDGRRVLASSAAGQGFLTGRAVALPTEAQSVVFQGAYPPQETRQPAPVFQAPQPKALTPLDVFMEAERRRKARVPRRFTAPARFVGAR